MRRYFHQTHKTSRNNNTSTPRTRCREMIAMFGMLGAGSEASRLIVKRLARRTQGPGHSGAAYFPKLSTARISFSKVSKTVRSLVTLSRS